MRAIRRGVEFESTTSSFETDVMQDLGGPRDLGSEIRSTEITISCNVGVGPT